MNQTRVAQLAPSASGQNPNKNQDELAGVCRVNNWELPRYELLSDRRGGRTAWSAYLVVQGHKVEARFWYDGQYVNNAKEDAAQVALGRMRPPNSR